MIRLKSSLNYRGVLIEKGSVIGYLPVELQEKLIKSGAAERVVPEAEKENKTTSEKTIDKMTKAELLEYAAKAGIPGISEDMTKAEIIDAISTMQQEKGDQKETDEKQEEANDPGKADG